MSHEKKKLTVLFSFESWLVNDGILIYNGLYYHNWLVFHPQKTTQPTMGPFFVAQVDPKDPWDRRLHSYLKSIDPGPKIIHLMDRDLILIPVQLIRGSTQNLLNETKY